MGERVVKYSALQSITELGLGSLLHQFHVPLTGQALSLNQTAIQTMALRSTRSECTRAQAIQILTRITLLAAGLKAFSPMGKRLTPMLAITVQGLLYTLGVAFFGINIAGVLLGAVLSSLWAFAQPLLIAWLLMGETFFQAVTKLWIDFANQIGWDPEIGLLLLAVGVLLKVLLSIFLGAWAWSGSSSFEKKYQELELSWRGRFQVPPGTAPSDFNPWKLALKDFFRPIFLIPALLSIGFFIFSGEPSNLTVFYYSVRVLVGGYLLFLLLRSFRGERLRKYLEKSGQLGDVVAELERQRSRTSKS